MTSRDPNAAERPGQADWKRRAAAAEINARRVNEAIERGSDGPAPVFVCECGYLGCSETVRLSLAEYESVRTSFDRFFLIPGHEIEAVDRVIERHSGYLVVVKREPRAKAMARDADLRSG